MKFIRPLFFFILLMGGVVWMITWGDRSTPENFQWFCDAETTTVREGRTYWISNGKLFSNAKTQSDKTAFSGKFSSRCDSIQPYGMAFHLGKISPQTTFYVALRRYGNDENACLLITGNRGYYREIHLASSSQRGWDLLEEYFTLPEGAEDDSLVFSAYYKGKNGCAYFDDLWVEKVIDQVPKAVSKDFPILEINLPQSDWNSILEQRSRALEKGILLEENEKPVPMELTVQGRTIPGKIRLKGDWIDHLKGEEWSFRLECNDSIGVNGLTEFSIMRLEARDYLREWMFKKALKEEGILTPDYELVRVVLRGKDLGLMAMEGVPNQFMVEHQERRDGPVLKWDESGFWEAKTRSFANANAPVFKGRWNVPKVVDRKSWINRPEGGVALEALRAWEQNAALRNVQIWAKYYALVDLFQAYHGLIWHNQRFYFNPVTHALEPIAIDGFTSEGIYSIDQRPIMAWGLQPQSSWGKDALQPFGLFRNPEFVKAYFAHLNSFSQTGYLHRLWSKYGAEIQKLTTAIQSKRSHYQYPMAASIRRAKEIQSYLRPLPGQVASYGLGGKVVVESHFGLPLEIFQEEEPQKFWLLPAFDSTLSPPRIALPASVKNLRCRIQGGKAFEKVGKRLPTPKVSTTQLMKLELPKGFVKNGNRITAGSGTWNSNCIVPARYVLEIPRGTQIWLQPHQIFWMEGAMLEVGVGNETIQVQGGSVYFHPENQQLNLSHWKFSGQREFKWGNIHSMGGVNVVDAKLNWKNVSLENITAEDGLNLVHCSGNLLGISVENVSGDGIDFDFCQISISRSQFRNTGNDGIDFSGGKAIVTRCDFFNNGDKSISCGEGNRFEGTHLNFENQRLGIGVKDLSVAKVEVVHCQKVQLAAKVFRKKPDWGGGQLVLKKIDGTYAKLYEKDQFSSVSLFP